MNACSEIMFQEMLLNITQYLKTWEKNIHDILNFSS